MEKFTLLITTKLRRVKYVRLFFGALVLPIKLPLLIFYKLGEWSEDLSGFMDYAYSLCESYFIDKFKLNAVAKKQYKENPNKFKTK